MDKVLGNLQHLPDSWPLIRFDLMLRKSASYCAIWRRFLHLNEYLRAFRLPTQPLISMRKGLLSIWCSFWPSGSLWRWNPLGSLQRFAPLTFYSFMIKTSGLSWVDLLQTMVLDRQGSYTSPVIGLVRCVCKDEHGQSGRSSSIKMRVCNLHFFAPVWMAQPIVQNFRQMSMADLEPRQPGFFDYKEGRCEWNGQGKHEEETFAGHTMGCIRLMILDNNVEPFHYHGWGPIKYFAAQGVIKDSIWNARMAAWVLKHKLTFQWLGL